MPCRKVYTVIFLVFISSCSALKTKDSVLHNSEETDNTFSGIDYENESSKKAIKLFSDFDQFLLNNSPMLRTSLGQKEEQSKWDDFSVEHQKLTHKQLQSFLDRTRSINPVQLNPQLNQSLIQLKILLEERIEAYQYRHYQYVFTQMFGAHNYLTTFLINDHSIDTKKDAEAYLIRLETIDQPLEALKDRVKANEASGISPPQFTYPLVIQSIDNLLSGYPLTGFGDHPLTKDFTKKLNQLDLNNLERSEYFQRFNQAMLTSYKTAYESLKDFLENQQKLASKDLGVMQFASGLQYYQFKLKSYTTQNVTPDELHRLGLSEVRRIHKDIETVMRSLNFKGDLASFFKFTQSSPNFKIGNSHEERHKIMQWNQELISRMKSKLPEAFNFNVTSGLEIKAVESFREKSTGLAFYQRPGIFSSKPGIYYLNLHKAQHNPSYLMPALAYHEGIPGHHYQLSIQKSQKNLPLFRKIYGFTVFTEGWALYAETLANEMNMYANAYEYYGFLIMDLKRAIRLVVDTGLHAKGWSATEAINYRMANSPASYKDSKSAIERFLVMPGQAVAYTVGKMKILSLRDKAQSTLGSNFKLASFHDQVLMNGSVSLNMLENTINNWIEYQSARTAKSNQL